MRDRKLKHFISMIFNFHEEETQCGVRGLRNVLKVLNSDCRIWNPGTDKAIKCQRLPEAASQAVRGHLYYVRFWQCLVAQTQEKPRLIKIAMCKVCFTIKNILKTSIFYIASNLFTILQWKENNAILIQTTF